MVAQSTFRTFVFVVGFALEMYGMLLLVSNAELTGLFWMSLGLIVQIAAAERGPTEKHRRFLENPIAMLAKGLHDIRRTVQSWDKRE